MNVNASRIPEPLPEYTDEVIDTCRAMAVQLEQLYKKPRGNGQRPTDMNQLREHIHAIPKEQPLGRAFSGDGICGPTFNLRVLQGLTDRLIAEVHFLSTVSGGEYIGSWCADVPVGSGTG